MMEFERVEYFCTQCGNKGVIDDVLIHPDVVLLRGHCAGCKLTSYRKAVDLVKMAKQLKLDEQQPIVQAFSFVQ